MKSNTYQDNTLILKESDSVIILPEKVISHFQRLERLVAKELSSLYLQLNDLKILKTDYYDLAHKSSPNGEFFFKKLNKSRNEYKTILNRIKNLEETQKEIRRITRNQ